MNKCSFCIYAHEDGTCRYASGYTTYGALNPNNCRDAVIAYREWSMRQNNNRNTTKNININKNVNKQKR